MLRSATVRTIGLAVPLALALFLVLALVPVSTHETAHAVELCLFHNVYGYDNHKTVNLPDGDTDTVQTFLQAAENSQGQYCGEMRSFNIFTCTLCIGYHNLIYGDIVYKTTRGGYVSDPTWLGILDDHPYTSGNSNQDVAVCGAAEAYITGGDSGYIETGTAEYCPPK